MPPRILSTTTHPDYDLSLSYDSTSSASSASSPPSPPPSPRHLLRRIRSPSPSHPSPLHTHHHLPCVSHHPSKYLPSTRAADISRLLDPSYSPTKSHSPCLTVYVDQHGDLHDPDYRHFPPVRVYDADLHNHLDNDDGDDERRYRTQSAYAYDDRSRRRSSSASRNTANAYSTRFTSYAYDDHAPVYRYDEPASYDSPLLPTDEDDAHHLPLTEKRRPRSRSGDDTIESEVIIHDDENDEEAQNEWTPSCTHTLRRQWQALALRLRFGLFRTKRRIKRRVGRSIKGAT